MTLPIMMPFKHTLNINQIIKYFNNLSGKIYLPIYEKPTFYILDVINDLDIYFEFLNIYHEAILKNVKSNVYYLNLLLKSNIDCKVKFDNRVYFNFYPNPEFNLNKNIAYHLQFISLDDCLSWQNVLTTGYDISYKERYNIETPSVLDYQALSVNSQNNVATIKFNTSDPLFIDQVDTPIHYMSDWQLSDDISFNNIVYESINDINNIRSITINDLHNNTTYYLRVRYYCFSSNLSNWSDGYKIIISF